MEQKTVWKVTDGKNRSVRLKSTLAASIQYLEGEFVSAPKWLSKYNYNILAFDNDTAAFRFASMLVNQSILHPIKVWKATAINLHNHLPEMRIWHRMQKEYLKNLEITSGTQPVQYTAWPYGTVMCEQLKLIECVGEYIKTIRRY